MSTNDSLGDRIKTYEDAYRINLPIRMPIILRVDGRSFHSYLRGCQKPFDPNVIECMNLTAIELCKEVQGCQLAYVQSDEISLLITNYQTITTQSWYHNNLQKMVSVAASISGTTFSLNSWRIWGSDHTTNTEAIIRKPAYFDARAFVVPKEEVCNAILWRQQDATRNSVQMLARSLYSHKECNDKNNAQLQEMCWQKGINWNDLPTAYKRGRSIVRQQSEKPFTNKQTGETNMAVRSECIVDNEIPIFSQDRDYINRLVFTTDKEIA
jgi:tRNA(His) guanylyltransferase